MTSVCTIVDPTTFSGSQSVHDVPMRVSACVVGSPVGTTVWDHIPEVLHPLPVQDERANPGS